MYASRLVVAVAAIGLICSAQAHAGGTAGTKGKKNVSVLIKNIGAETVQVNAASGPSVSLTGGTTLAVSNQKQFTVKSGQFSAIVRGVVGGRVKSNLFNASSAPVYLYAEADATAATLTVAPPF